MTQKKKVLFILADIILVGIVATLIGLFCNDWSNPVRFAVYILLLLTLTIPGIAALIYDEFGSPSSILTIILFVANVVAMSIMFGLNSTDHKALIITETIIGGSYIMLLLVSLAVGNKQK